MIRTETPICDFNQAANDFNLKGVDGNYYSLNNLKGKNGLLVMFICNHCPMSNLLFIELFEIQMSLKF